VFGLSQNLISRVSRLGAFPSSDCVTVHCGRRLVIDRMLDVLLVDDETHFLKSLAEGLRLYSKKLHVITADNGKKAVEILNTAVVDVVVTSFCVICSCTIRTCRSSSCPPVRRQASSRSCKVCGLFGISKSHRTSMRSPKRSWRRHERRPGGMFRS
jgi:hypothetical protein